MLFSYTYNLKGKKDEDPSFLPASFMVSLKTTKSNPYMINFNVCYTIAPISLLCGNNL